MNTILKEAILYDEKWSDPEYCLQAVKDDPDNFRIVRVQTPEMCEIAIDHDPMLLANVEKQTPELCVEAIKKDKYAYIFIKFPKKEPERSEFMIRLNELLNKNGLLRLRDNDDDDELDF